LGDIRRGAQTEGRRHSIQAGVHENLTVFA
jgi:hypothetical protein